MNGKLYTEMKSFEFGSGDVCENINAIVMTQSAGWLNLVKNIDMEWGGRCCWLL